MRSGTVWDVLALVGLGAPLAAVLVPGLGLPASRVLPVGRAGAVVGAAAWVVVLAGEALPSVGAFEPDPLAVAAAAGTLLLAAGCANALAPPAAAAVALGAGLVAVPADLTTGEATALGVGGSIVAAGTIVAAGRWPVAVVVVPAGLLAALRVPSGAVDAPPAAGAVALFGSAAVVAAVLPRFVAALRGRAGPAGLALAAGGAALTPVAGVAVAAGLLAAAAVLAATLPARPWTLAAALPGAAVVAKALADVPVPEPPSPGVHVALGVAAAAAAAGVVVAGTRRAEGGAESVPAPVEVVVGVVGLHLLLAPGSWTWATGGHDVLAAWEQGTALAVAAGLLVVAADRLRAVARK